MQNNLGACLLFSLFFFKFNLRFYSFNLITYSKYSGCVCYTAVFLFNLTTNGFEKYYNSINVKISYS